MCGRFALDDKVDEQIQEFVAAGNDFRDWTPDEWDRWRPNYQYFPTNKIPIVVETPVDRADPDGPTVRRVEAARWWLTPSWSKTLEVKATMFNAVAEELDQKSSFRNLIARHRCVIPAAGFYEWSGPKSKRTPNYVTDPEGYLFFAGLYSWWADPADKAAHKDDPDQIDWRLTTTILTTPPSGRFTELHNRAPVALPYDRIDDWISSTSKGDMDLVTDIAASAIPIIERMDWYPVRPLSRDAHGPELIEPV